MNNININGAEEFVKSVNRNEVKKCERLQQEIKEQVFYDD